MNPGRGDIPDDLTGTIRRLVNPGEAGDSQDRTGTFRPGSGETAKPAKLSLAEGDSLGPYAITGVLGRGGMGVVYAGRHVETGVRAAIKTVSATQAYKIVQIRREIETLARLEHPGIVSILDHAVTDGLPWYAMKLLEGVTLGAVRKKFWPKHAGSPDSDDATQFAVEIAGTAGAAPVTGTRQRLPMAANGRLPEALGLIQRLCETLAYVHGEGVVHRDLKPSNIFVSGEGLPVLVDFGLVAHVGVATGREVLDQVMIGGSVGYMAPEQISGGLLDPRTDIYSLGCVIYELLTGQVPFQGSVEQVMFQHLRTPAKRLSEMVAGVPAELEHAIARVLAKDPLDRLAYARDIAAMAAAAGAVAPAWPGRLPRNRPYLCRPPLSGRREVLAKIDAAISGLAAGRGKLVLISGESGVGKTRVALEAAQRAAARETQLVSGVCTPVLRAEATGIMIPGAPLHPLAPLLRAIADRCAEEGVSYSERIVGENGPVLSAYSPVFRDVPGQKDRPAAGALPPALARERLFRSLTETIAAFAMNTPVMVLLDDLQWADELTLGWLTYLARGPIRTMRLLLLATIRAEESNDALASLGSLEGILNVPLERLSASEVSQMVGGMLALREPPRGFVSFLTTNSEGNPFFVTEYLRMAVAEQVVVRTPAGEWKFAASTDPTEVLCESLPLPRSLRDVIDQRLSSLSVPAGRVLICATLIGREFDAATIRAALMMEEAEVNKGITELATRRVIEPVETADAFRFAHDKLREIPAASIPAVERRYLHGRIAAALALQPGEKAADDAAIGHHWAGAGEAARAIPYLHRAADHAFALQALADAAELYRSALRSVAELRARDEGIEIAEEAALREKLGDALGLTGAQEKAREEYQQSIAALGLASPVVRARLHRKVGKTLDTQHEHARALEAYGLAEQLLEAAGEQSSEWRAEWIQLHLNRIWVFYWQARIDEMDLQIERTAPVVEAHGLPLQRSSFHQAIITRDYRKHRYVVSSESLEHARKSVAFAMEANARVEAGFARFVLGFGLLFHGDLTGAEAELYEALLETRRLGDVTSQVRCLAYLLIAYRMEGRVADCRTLAEETLPMASGLKMRDYLGVAQAALGWAAWRTNDTEEARGHCRAALESWNQPGYVYPFQWTANLTLLAAEVSLAPLRQLVSTAEAMLEERQMRLPDSVQSPLRAAVAAYDAQDAETTREALQLALAEAQRLGFL